MTKTETFNHNNDKGEKVTTTETFAHNNDKGEVMRTTETTTTKGMW